MRDFIKASISANEEIYKALQNGIDRELFDKTTVGAGGDISSRLDILAEDIFIKHLSSFGQIKSEESGIIGEGESTIIIDPIDGSSNALSLFPFYGTSVARINSEGILDEAIVCNLANGDIFIKYSNKETLQGKLFSNNFHPPYSSPNPEIGLFEKSYANGDLVKLLDADGFKFRTPGAIALSLAYARGVRFVLFMGKFRIYDLVAGLALCEGLEVIVEEDYVIVSRDKMVLDHIEKLIKELQ